MGKNNVLMVAQSKFTTILETLGVPFITQSGFLKVSGAKGRNMYIANTKTVGRIDLSGFEVEFGAKLPHCGVFGNVKQQLDLDIALGEEGILQNFTSALEVMLSLPAVEKVSKAKAAKVEAKPEYSTVTAEEIAQAALARRLLIAKTAEEMGAMVSELA